MGAAGDTGPQGPNGNTFFYGNSDSAFTLTPKTFDFDSDSEGAEVLQFSSFSISAGAQSSSSDPVRRFEFLVPAALRASRR